MANTREETTITWGGSPPATSVSLNDNNWHISDEVLLNVNDFSGKVQGHADNGSTPVSGDDVQVKILYSTGNVDASSPASDDYDDEAGVPISMILDTYDNADPDVKSANVDASCKGFKLAAKASQGATRTITFRAGLITHRIA